MFEACILSPQFSFFNCNLVINKQFIYFVLFIYLHSSIFWQGSQYKGVFSSANILWIADAIHRLVFLLAFSVLPSSVISSSRIVWNVQPFCLCSTKTMLHRPQGFSVFAYFSGIYAVLYWRHFPNIAYALQNWSTPGHLSQSETDKSFEWITWWTINILSLEKDEQREIVHC